MKIKIDNKVIEAEHGSTILEAAASAGIRIPTLCHLGGCKPETSCLVCVVRVNNSKKLVPSCAIKVEDGMVIESETEEIHKARRIALELLLGDHTGDCIGPCQGACPAHMDIPSMLRHIASGNLRDAIAVVKDRIALPAVLGRICPEICEKACRRSSYDAAVSICRMKRYVADFDLASETPYVPECAPSTGKRVAIVGAGPAGLSAAYYLQQMGHSCVVYDEHPLPGGALRYSIPQEKLPSDVVDAEIEIIKQLGVRFKSGTKITDVAELRRSCDAVLLAIGPVKQEAADSMGLKLSGNGLSVDKTSHMTSIDGVFAAGSAVTPSHIAVRAVADGRSSAVVISQYLEDAPMTWPGRPFSVHIGHLVEDEIMQFLEGTSLAGRMSATFSDEDARKESRRCLHCECSGLATCRLKLHAEEYGAHPTRFKGTRDKVVKEKTHPDIVFEPGKCISCGLCVQIAGRQSEALGLGFIGRGFTVAVGVPFDEPLSEGLRETAEECARACPTAAIEIRRHLQ